VAVGGVIGALPAGVIGVRIGRRNAMLLGFALMAVCLLALNNVTSITQVTPLLALASASWTLPTVNAYPLLMAWYTALAFVAVLFVPPGTGEADTGPESASGAQE
jgi:MFS family permease